MSKSGEGEEEEQQEEEFYESLDRILSSSCSSTSASDDDADHYHVRCRGGGGGVHHRLPRFPPALAASYEFWLSDPASAEERRPRLLQRMGLTTDPTLARPRSDNATSAAAVSRSRDPAEVGRSVSCDGLFHSSSSSPAAAGPIVRSRSDGSVDSNLVHKQQQPQASHHHRQPSLGLPPLVARSRPSFESDGNDPGDGDEEQRRCTIRNLDNGEEFVVKEVGEDGMWGKLREVGTGRQLTMEEFEMCVGRSPIVQELMRRQTAQDSANTAMSDRSSVDSGSRSSGGAARAKKRGGWLRSIRNVAGTVVAGGHYRDRRSSDERDTSSEKGGRRSSSATDDSQDGSHSFHHGPKRVKVRHYGKSHKELTGLYLSQEIQAHSGSIWSIKFSPDGKFLASAGEDCVIHVWQVSEYERREEFLLEREVAENGNCNPFFAVISNGSPEPTLALTCVEANHWEKKRRAKVPGTSKSVSLDHLMVPDYVFALLQKPVCSFKGHLADVLDLSWSKSQYLLSSSMDKTVRLWHMSSNSCLKTFAHSDYVTCIQFNPVDDRYFISGSLDGKVRIWSIPDRQVVDWNDLNGMVTAACYTPDGRGALVGSHKGSCHLYDTSDNKLQQKSQIDLQNKKKRSNHKKITGLQFTPGSSSEVLITSADSRIRVVDGTEVVHKFKDKIYGKRVVAMSAPIKVPADNHSVEESSLSKARLPWKRFRNTSSQISSSLTANGKYVICASEDSHVYMWRYDVDSRPNRSKGAATVTQAYEHFHCHDVTVAVPWLNGGLREMMRTHSDKQNEPDSISQANLEELTEANGHESSSLPAYRCTGCCEHGSNINGSTSHFSDRVSATWPEEKLLMSNNRHSPQSTAEHCNGRIPLHSRSAWGLVIVTAGRGGEIKVFQNFGFPVRI